ncbi:hypothetical protein [Nocardia jinanensis]|uniref:Uncharacterized protein n=1 Tax=Nocardia jinanensis TaxID=382504 RepID=A0A917VRK7_9NOCA|nr:hypothetical protein [Nocardia jinanensis]GGL07434.1 hypothetical protein GCM10011588_22410 [Nocardia jinanensis]
MPEQHPPLPTRTTNRAMAATLRLWQVTWCTDPTILEQVAAGLRELPDAAPRTLHSPSGIRTAPDTDPGTAAGIPRHPDDAGF